MAITTIETMPEADKVFNIAPPSMWSFVAYICLIKGKKPPERIWTPSGTVQAFVNHSRWVADCPVCRSAMIVSRKDPVFYCPDCQQSGWRDVMFPANADEIEALLVARPDPTTRNWNINEPVEKLQAENIAHEIGRVR